MSESAEGWTDTLFREGIDYHEKDLYRFQRAYEAVGRPAGKSVLDVGAYPGTAFRVFGKHNQYTSFGLINDPDYRLWMSSNGIEHIDANIESYNRQNEADVILFMEIMEHLRRPYATLRNLHSLAKPGALVYVTTNNASYYGYLLKLLAGRDIYDSIDTEAADYPGHTRYYGLDELAREFSKAGFSIVSRRYVNLLPATRYYRNRLFAIVKNSLGAIAPPRYRTHIEIVARR